LLRDFFDVLKHAKIARWHYCNVENLKNAEFYAELYANKVRGEGHKVMKRIELKLQ